MRHSATKPSDPEADLRRLGTEFLASINHDIRTPLSGIVWTMDLLEETPLSEEQREYVRLARGCAQDILHALSDALEYAALASGQFALEDVPFNVSECLEAAVQASESQAAAKHLDLRLAVAADVPGLAVGDAARLRSVLMHIVDNAVRFTHAGSVTVKATAEDASPEQFVLRIEVRDTGAGVPLDSAARLFDALQRGEAPFEGCDAGIGMGLALSARIISRMNGTMELESAEGQGSAFLIRIPLELPADSPMPHAVAGAGGRRVLIVEDNALALRVAAHVLQQAGYRVDGAASGEQAVAAAAANRYGLILMDLEMPGMDGLTATREIRRMGRTDTPILALTAHAPQDYRNRCLAEGMQGFLSKPVRASELLSSVRRILRP